MELVEPLVNGMLAFLSNLTSVMCSVFYYLLEPHLLRGYSGSLHLVLLVMLIISFVCSRYRESSEKVVLSFKYTLLSGLIFLVSNLILCSLSYFYWHRIGWPDDKLVTLLDLVPRTLSWSVLGIYLHFHFSYSAQDKSPILSSVWWGFCFTISFCSLFLDIVLYSKSMPFNIHYLLSDIVCVFIALFLCYVKFLQKSSNNTLLQKPLLDDHLNLRNKLDSTKSRGSDSTASYSNAGLFSILTFSWMGSLIAVGNQKTLDLEDIPQLYREDTAARAFLVFRNKLVLENGAATGVTTFKLLKALMLPYWKDFLLMSLLAVLYALSSFVGPYLINSFIDCLSGQGESKNSGYLLACTFFVAKLVECLSQRKWWFSLEQGGIRIRAVLVSTIYNKCMTLSHLSKQGQTSGEIINLMANDVERVGKIYIAVQDLWLVILQGSLALLILYKNLGLASVAVFVAAVLIMLLNYPLMRLQKRFQHKIMDSKDNRMKMTSEVLRNMRILKLQGWEMKFLAKIVDLRKLEEGWLEKYVYASVLPIFFFHASPAFVSVATFGACILMEIPFETGKIISALAIFRILQEPICKLPARLSSMVQTKVSLERIASFLDLQDLQSDVVEKLPRSSSDIAIEIVDGNFSWDLSSLVPTLKDINFKVKHGMRIAVCGAIGSGKSSLLSCILGELPKISGMVKLCGTKAYVSQSPWIQSGTIEDNILFGKGMDKERYEKILEACSLKEDLEMFSFGDQTVIGERGINLSGGQKQRIQIARALYQDSDIYLFDDPFSAVDAHTGSHIFKEVLLGLLNSKTVIYVTHQVEFLPFADIILVMKDGRIKQAGKYSDILVSGSDFVEFVNAHGSALLQLSSKREGPLSENEKMSEDYGAMSSTNKILQKNEKKDLQNGKSDVAEPKRQLIEDEKREKGRVGFSIYWKYMTTAYGGALVPFILLAETIFELLKIVSNYWMASATPKSNYMKPVISESKLISAYVAFAIGSSFCILLRVILVQIAEHKTAALLFNKMHLCLFRAPMSFFDATPSGRILNRASTDQRKVDMETAYEVGAVAFTLINLLVIIGVMSQVAWQVLIIFIPVFYICIGYQKYYIASARELSRLVGLSRAPIFQHFSETISGLISIRSFDQQSRFLELNMKLVDAYSRTRFHIAGGTEWLCLRQEMLSCITFALSLIFLIYFPGKIDPGLAVTYGLNLNTAQSLLISRICDLENRIISVERILQFICIPSEPPLVIEGKRPDHSWPFHGEVSIKNLRVRYAPHMPLVLQGISCTFPGGKKIGVVGRTGSGKSTLVQTLFRIVEPAAGQIVIDGVNISSIGLHDLRSRLSIIPQDPTMFEGTVRSNMDPLEEYTDEQIWEALDICQLGDEVRKKEKRLDQSVTENGENWSVGQRQLVCLGRVLLKKSKVLVLDEATASVDTATDNLIQHTIRQHFTECTVITVAHRITSVLDSDMILLLSKGLVEEYDSPARLLENKSSSFAKLVAEYTERSNTSFYSAS
ncbi:ABC transporter C family member 3-like isoform X2 [Euphorbia lathyris]|uniref:ABC transporter C family member 3-like isoform X2 n=1 Tax=Euphorbia lathyris TaxID=212925 RepID=UPI003313F805